jgi:hypothetical protein
MLVLGIILGSLCLILVNTIAFNSLIDDLDELKKPIRVLLFIPPLSIIAMGVFVLAVFFMFIIDSFKKTQS